MEIYDIAAVNSQACHLPRPARIRSRHGCFIDTAGTGSSAARTFNVSTAAALFIGGVGDDLSDARRLAEQSIESGAAMRKLEQLIQRTNTETIEY